MTVTQFSLMDQKLADQVAKLEPRQLHFMIGYMWSRISLLSNSAVADDAASIAYGYAACSQFAGTLPEGTAPVKGAVAEGPLP